MERTFEEPDLKALLEEAQSIAVVGIKDHAHEDAYRIPAYMQAHGYRIIPVNPKLSRVLEVDAYPSLVQIPTAFHPVDIINLFRASEHLPAHVDEILALPKRPRVVWTQLGIHHGPSAQRLRDVGITVIQDRCIMVDHRQLLSNSSP